MKTKNQYQQHIAEYLKRRQKIRDKYPKTLRGETSVAYQAEIAAISRKLKHWKQAIRRIEKREKQLESIAKVICEFLSIDYGIGRPLRNSVESYDPAVRTGRDLLYKYGMENGIPGVYISWWVGGDKRVADWGRMRFTRSFKHNSENKRIWDQFNFYLKHNVNVGEGGYISLEAA